MTVEAGEENKGEQDYLDMLKNILENGTKCEDRTKIGTLRDFGTKLEFDISDGSVPLMTTKEMNPRLSAEEMFFFFRGDTDTKKLEEMGINIWKGNTSRAFLDKQGLQKLPEGSLGKGYGFQWRNSGGEWDTNSNCTKVDESRKGIDQIKNLIDGLINDPDDRRHIVTAWNVSQLHEMSLPPCHMTLQCYVNNGELSLQWYQRSVDCFLGLPFNSFGYALFTRLVAEICGLKAKKIIFIGGDTHIYLNHIEQVKKQITRKPYKFPKMNIKKKINSIKDIEEMTFSDLEIVDYKCHPKLTGKMAI